MPDETGVREDALCNSEVRRKQRREKTLAIITHLSPSLGAES